VKLREMRATSILNATATVEGGREKKRKRGRTYEGQHNYEISNENRNRARNEGIMTVKRTTR
jgi:hypothetical protein